MGWSDIDYEMVPVTDLRLLAVTDAIRVSHVNGGPLLRIFRPIDTAAFDEAARTDLQGVDHLLRCFLEAPSVRSSVPELRIPASFPELPTHTWYGAF